MNHEDIKILNKPLTSEETNAVIKNFPTQKFPRPHGFTAESYQTFKEELIPFFSLFQRIEEEGILLNSFFETSITLLPKSDKDKQGGGNSTPIFLMNIHAKTLNRVLAN